MPFHPAIIAVGIFVAIAIIVFVVGETIDGGLASARTRLVRKSRGE